MKLYVSSPNDGGLSCIENGQLTEIEKGDARGLTYSNNELYYVNGGTVRTQQAQAFDLPVKLWHDIKYDNLRRCFYLLASEAKELYELTSTGSIQRIHQFDACYWPNCCLPIDDKLIVFLSAKRPYSKSKIICLNEDWSVEWEYHCFENDEIHSPCFFDGDLYWCRSNQNAVVRASLKSKLRDVIKVIVNNSGYTRGLLVSKSLIVLGTSQNRHAENCLCQSEINHGCLHFYDGDSNLQEVVHLNYKEVYDIL